MLLNEGDQQFRATPILASDNFFSALGVEDLDRDGLPDLVLAVNQAGVETWYNQLRDRADTNGSNRIDGFDVAAVSRLAGARAADCDNGSACSYRRTADADLNGVINGDDLALVALRFGRLRAEGSPLRGTLAGTAAPEPRTVSVRQAASEGDMLTVEVLADGAGQPAAAADFTLTFHPAPGDVGKGQVLEVAGFDPGTFLSGGAGQVFTVDTATPGAARIQVSRLPNADLATAGPEPLLSLFLRARREGEAVLDFAPNGHPEPALLTASDQELSGIRFQGGAAVEVISSDAETPGQRIGAGPASLDLGVAPVGGSARKMLRVSNFGFSELRVTGVGSALEGVTTSFTSAFTVPPYGFIELPVVFAPAHEGFFSGELLIASDDPRTPQLRAPIVGRTDGQLVVTPARLDFGAVPVGGERALRLRLVNRGPAPLTLASSESNDAAFVAEPGFVALDPGEAGEVLLRFRPSSNGEAHASLRLDLAGSGARTVVVALAGTGGALAFR